MRMDQQLLPWALLHAKKGIAAEAIVVVVVVVMVVAVAVVAEAAAAECGGRRAALRLGNSRPSPG